MNQAIIMGRVGRDPEVKFTNAGKAVCQFSVATTEKWKNQRGEPQEQTEWHECVAWEKSAENIGKYFKKGDMILVIGKLQTRSWEDQNGQKRYKTEVRVERFEFTGGGQRGGVQQRSAVPASGDPFDGDALPF